MKKNLKSALALAVGMGVLPAVAAGIEERELVVSSDLQDAVVVLSQDFRTVFPVAKLQGESALQGLMYSAVGWELEETADPSRTVTVTAQAGRLTGEGTFSPDGSEAILVLPARTGRGTTDWKATDGIQKKVYQLAHTVKKNGDVDAAACLFGYLDFTHCATDFATQEEVEAAVLGSITHKIAVTQDEVWPWQPIDLTVVRSGIVTDEGLEPEAETETIFDFKGRGVLHYEYDLSGGELVVIADDKVVATFAEPKADFVPCHVSFDGYGAHEVSFVYTAVGGAVAAIRNVRWEVQDESSRTTGAGEEIRVDLQEGEVRTPKKFAHVLPFVYSPTNFTGTVDGKSSRVSIVRLEGTDPDVTKWTTEVPGTARVLKEATDEGEVKWRAKKGVWKATFEIFDGDKLKETQIKYFDLRNANGNGLVLFVT